MIMMLMMTTQSLFVRCHCSVEHCQLKLHWCDSCIHSFIHSGCFYSASSSPLLLRSDPDTAVAQILCRSFTPKRSRQFRVKDLPMVPMWRLERNSNPHPFS